MISGESISEIGRRKSQLAIATLANIYRKRFDRDDEALRNHPLLVGPTTRQLNAAGALIYKDMLDILASLKATILKDTKFLKLEASESVCLAPDKEKAKKTLQTDLRKWMEQNSELGIDSARNQPHLTASIRVDWEGFMDDAVVFLDKYTISLSEHLTAQAEWELRSTIMDGLIQGKGATSIAADINKLGDEYEGRAMKIARTEGMRAMNTGKNNAYKAMGVEEVVWIASDLACEYCKPLDGKIFTFDELPPIPAHPSCRCCTAAFVEGYMKRTGDTVEW